MKILSIISGLILSSSLAFAISDSTTLSTGAGVSDFDVTLYRAFQMADGMVVNQASQISQISYRDVLLGNGSMFLTVNGKKYRFKLGGSSVNVNKGYASVYGSTAAGSTGQGIGVSVSQNYSAYSPIKTQRPQTNTCYGDRVEVCRDFSHNGYGYQCLSDAPTGSETVMMEYSEQTLPATMTLLKGGTKLASVSYLTKAFNSTELYTIDYCDADDFFAEQEIRRELRQRLRQMYGRKGKGKGKGKNKGKGKGKGKGKIKRH